MPGDRGAVDLRGARASQRHPHRSVRAPLDARRAVGHTGPLLSAHADRTGPFVVPGHPGVDTGFARAHRRRPSASRTTARRIAAGRAAHPLSRLARRGGGRRSSRTARRRVVDGGPGGRPDARFLLLKDVTERGFWFSGDTRSPKGRELTSNAVAALTLYWRERGRQIRVRGTVVDGGPDVSARDFRERSVTARAVATASRQSEVLTDPAEYERVVRAAAASIEAEPDFVSSTWRAWCLVPDSVEFWQADPGRRHQRWSYRRSPRARVDARDSVAVRACRTRDGQRRVVEGERRSTTIDWPFSWA